MSVFIFSLQVVLASPALRWAGTFSVAGWSRGQEVYDLNRGIEIHLNPC